ncbi:MAG: oxidoreductase [Lysinibacillus sp.]
MAKLRSALIVGATGLVGSHLVKEICDHPQYVSVTALVRNPLSYEHEKLTDRTVNFDALTEADVEFVDDVFCCLGTTRKKAGSREQFEKVDVEYPLQIAALAKHAGANHFVVITAMGASETSAAYYNRVKGKLEQQLQALHFQRLSIVRPSLLVGERSELRLVEKSGEVLLKLINPLLIGPLKRYRSIEAIQVARAMLAIALQPKETAVSIYLSDELANIKLPKSGENQVGGVFDWRKLNEEDIEPLDEEVVFKRKNVNVLDEEITFKKREIENTVIDENVVFDKRRLQMLKNDDEK